MNPALIPPPSGILAEPRLGGLINKIDKDEEQLIVKSLPF